MPSPLRLAVRAALVVLGGLAGVPATPAACQRLTLPAEAGGFRLVDSTRYERPELGARYRYSGPERVGVDVYVYPVPTRRLQLADSLRLAEEAAVFVASLPAAVEQGGYDDFSVPVNAPRAFESSRGEVAGHVVVAVLARQGRAHISFMHLIVVGDHYVKTRLTLPHEQWQTSLAPNFPLDLFRRLQR